VRRLILQSPAATQMAATSPICSPNAAGAIRQIFANARNASCSIEMRTSPSRLSTKRIASPPITKRLRISRALTRRKRLALLCRFGGSLFRNRLGWLRPVR